MESEIRHLRLVVAIAESGSVTRAAERLHLTQSALSHQLRDIETRLGTPLFHRVGRRMRLTAAGERFRESASEALEVVERMEQRLKAAASGVDGVLRLATECYTVYHWLPSVLKAYGRRHPRVEVRIDPSATSRPVSAVLEAQLDLAIMMQAVRDRRLASRLLFEDELFAIVSPDHPFARQPFVSLRDFASQTLLLYTEKGDSSFYQRVLAPAGIAPKVQAVRLTEAKLELVKAGLGVAVLAGWAVAPLVRARQVRAVRITRGGISRDWHAVTLRGLARLPYVQDFIDLLVTHAPARRAPSAVAVAR